VFLEVEVPAKPFAANVTREWLLVVVRVHVKRQVVHLKGVIGTREQDKTTF